MKQVEKNHYTFSGYQTPERFTSYYYQLKTTLEIKPDSVLEIGVGDGIFSMLLSHHSILNYGMDIDLELNPSVNGSVMQIPFRDESIDLCVAFQILEHLPFEHLTLIAAELFRVSRLGVVISLPEFGNASLALALPYMRKIRIAVPRAFPFRRKHKFDGQHYWEINKRGYPRARIINTFQKAGLNCEKTWLNPYNPYHRFFIFRKIHDPINPCDNRHSAAACEG